MDQIKIYRDKIDKIDNQIMQLLEERFNIVLEIKTYKQQQNIAIFDPSREQQILNKCQNYKFNNEITNIYKHILNESKNVQMGLKWKV